MNSAAVNTRLNTTLHAQVSQTLSLQYEKKEIHCLMSIVTTAKMLGDYFTQEQTMESKAQGFPHRLTQ